MFETFEPAGPYYMTLACECEERDEPVTIAFVDGFHSASDAWSNSTDIRRGGVEALDEYGEPIQIDGEDILQIVVVRATGANFPKAFLAA